MPWTSLAACASCTLTCVVLDLVRQFTLNMLAPYPTIMAYVRWRLRVRCLQARSLFAGLRWLANGEHDWSDECHGRQMGAIIANRRLHDELENMCLQFHAHVNGRLCRLEDASSIPDVRGGGPPVRMQ